MLTHRQSADDHAAEAARSQSQGQRDRHRQVAGDARELDLRLDEGGHCTFLFSDHDFQTLLIRINASLVGLVILSAEMGPLTMGHSAWRSGFVHTTGKDHEFTDWEDLERFVDAFLVQVAEHRDQSEKPLEKHPLTADKSELFARKKTV